MHEVEIAMFVSCHLSSYTRSEKAYSMSLLQAVVYGLVQGLGEFLPISSSAHLVLVPWLFGWQIRDSPST